jgi:acyl homoserine lactone synthase
MIRIVTKDNAERHVSNLYQMHRIRKTVFKDRLGWDVTVSGELEVDEYDALGPRYLLSIDRYGTVNGCVRLLPTTGPNMLRDIFPSFVTKAAVPCGEPVWEASRFAVSGNTTAAEAGISQTTYDLLIGVLKSATLPPWPDSLPCPHTSSDSLRHAWASRTQPQPDRKRD